MNVLRIIRDVFSIKELRDKILFTLAMLAVYRIGFWIPIPGVDQSALTEYFQQNSGSGAGQLASYVSIFSGGAFGQSTIFGLGIMPYISASIIFQLFGSVSPQLKKLREEGPSGQQKIMEWTRYLTIGLCIVQAVGWLYFIKQQNMVYPEMIGNTVWWIMAVACLTAGTVFLMWLGEQIDRFGIGNGVSLIIMAGILTGMPGAIMQVYDAFDPTDPSKMGWLELGMLIATFVGVVAGAVIMTVAQRQIPIQQAKHTRGQRVFGGQKSYLPLRVNHGGVMPIIFASSLMIFPSVILNMVHDGIASSGAQGFLFTSTQWLANAFTMGAFPYIFLYILMTIFFSYFWITVQFNPEEMATRLRDNGSFIPGLRPGPRTAEYLETVMERLTYVGGAFLAIIAVLPYTVQGAIADLDFAVTQFLGGTGLLIVVSVALDFLQRVEANLLMRNYEGFLGGDGDGKGPGGGGGGKTPRLRSARG